MTAWRRVAAVMQKARLKRRQISAKGLRHGLGAHAMGVGVALNVVQKWLGQVQLSAMAIYAEGPIPLTHVRPMA